MNKFNMYGYEAPTYRSDCKNNKRPCPWIRCKHHMVWILPNIIKLTDEDFIDFILNSSETCVLDMTDSGEKTLEEIGIIFGTTRERIRQIEESNHGGAILKLRCKRVKKILGDFLID